MKLTAFAVAAALAATTVISADTRALRALTDVTATEAMQPMQMHRKRMTTKRKWVRNTVVGDAVDTDMDMDMVMVMDMDMNTETGSDTMVGDGKHCQQRDEVNSYRITRKQYAGKLSFSSSNTFYCSWLLTRLCRLFKLSSCYND
ncbi:hypothetical protein KXD40_006311 [Peronospora effusa]|nr:hypothetical protein KXD40_006311 [Peronospora effusa]